MDIRITKIITMKHLNRLFYLLLLVSLAVFNSSCDNDDNPGKSEEELQLDKLKASTWQLVSANDGTDRTSEYPGMTLTYSGSFSAGGTYSYTSTATSWPSASPWKQNDSWKFVAGSVNSKLIRLSDDTEMTYALTSSDKLLTLTFDYAGPGFNNGRVEEVEGTWVFTFERP
jgi:hypothetical protein